MKLVKFVPALAATLVLAACSNANNQPAPQPTVDPVTKAADQATQQVNEIAGNAARGAAAVKVEKATDGSKSIVYRCQSGKLVTANYVFQGDDARAVNLVLQNGKKTQKIPTLARDDANQDFTSFKSDNYIWNVSTGFTLANATGETTGMLTKLGKGSDEILAKLCDVDKQLTSRLNK
ncbi:hypothetical protein [Mannheimia varigena]|uniref:hypothetical protein n=1 Tax=Mannheimia varigena TaxID=85404 RepID=UPI0003E38363|nr:hypothetical protein [Mannheimia varigena]AHG77120.1 hypothetical protein X874_4840 [Mannheimia varigena USDA-ARS-USMARC-1312]AHG80217.1 hypothetical protein X875_15990 [Mannheimia varigena USDA-ARS-USMARC-1388]QLB17677.1 hypothetical protein A6B40_08855 [Mannheimia varigena]